MSLLIVLVLIHVSLSLYELDFSTVESVETNIPENQNQVPQTAGAATPRCQNIQPIRQALASNTSWSITEDHYVSKPQGLYDQYLVFDESADLNIEDYVYEISGYGGAGIYITHSGDSDPKLGDMLRLTDDGTGFFWGHHDGSIFNGIGYYEIPERMDSYLVKVTRNEMTNSYDLFVDGVLEVPKIPLRYSYNRFGFTNSANDNVFSIMRCPNDSSPETANNEFDPLSESNSSMSVADAESGIDADPENWFFADQSITQVNPNASDYFFDTGFVASSYQMSVELKQLTNASQWFGPGALFFSGNSRVLPGALMIRFQNSGQEIFWGIFNEKSEFTGQGYTDLGATADKRVMNVVRSGRELSISVDGKAILEVQLQDDADTAGSIGLFSYGGPFLFQDLSFNWRN